MKDPATVDWKYSHDCMRNRAERLERKVKDLGNKLQAAEARAKAAERVTHLPPGQRVVAEIEWLRLVEVDRLAEEYVAQADKRVDLIRRRLLYRNGEILALKAELRRLGVAMADDGPLTLTP